MFRRWPVTAPRREDDHGVPCGSPCAVPQKIHLRRFGREIMGIWDIKGYIYIYDMIFIYIMIYIYIYIYLYDRYIYMIWYDMIWYLYIYIYDMIWYDIYIYIYIGYIYIHIYIGYIYIYIGYDIYIYMIYISSHCGCSKLDHVYSFLVCAMYINTVYIYIYIYLIYIYHIIYNIYIYDMIYIYMIWYIYKSNSYSFPICCNKHILPIWYSQEISSVLSAQCGTPR